MGTDPRIVKPFLRRNMERPQLFGRDNVCSTVRDLYMNAKKVLESNSVLTDEAVVSLEEIMLWSRIAVRMQKNMYNALKVYKEMLVEKGVKVDHDSREDWQLRGRGRGTVK